MKKELLPLLGLVLLTGCATHRVVTPTPADRSIVVLYDNDVHCNIDGYSLMAGLRDAVSDTSYVAMVTSGDYLQGGTAGAISHGEYVAAVMRSAHYDAIGLGNHEFDYGTDAMFKLLKTIDAPVVSANLRDMQDKPVFAPYIIREFGNKKVAFVGAVTPTALYTESYSFFDKDDNQYFHLSEKNLYQRVQEAVDAARNEGANYVIILSHIGNEENDLNICSRDMAAATHGIDVILDAHSHDVVPHEYVNGTDGKPVLITQTGTKFQHVGRLIIMPDGQMITKLVPFSQLTRHNAEVKHVTDSINALANAQIQRPICQCDVKLRILDDEGKQLVRRDETNAGDIVADAFRSITGAEIAITNGGGIRTEAGPGNLNYGDIVSLLPYDNYVSIIEIKGEKLVALLKACTQFLPALNGDFPQVSGMKFTIHVGAEEPITDLVILDKETGEYKPVELDRMYEMATTDYGITGGGLQGMLKKDPIKKPNLCVYNECLIKYVTEQLGGHIGQEYAEPQGRITVIY